MLGRLVGLNARRAEDERRGLVHWLRPDFQAPGEIRPEVQEALDVAEPLAAAAAGKLPWPKTLLEQVSAIRTGLARLPEPADPATIAGTFHNARKQKVAEVLATLAAMGHARCEQGRYWRGA